MSGSVAGPGVPCIPSEPDLLQVLQRSETPHDIACVEKMAAALVDVARRCEDLNGELARLLQFRLRSRHKLGLAIRATVRPGGKRTKGRAAEPGDHSLPKNIDRFEARKCRDFAAIPLDVLEAYFVEVAAKQHRPSEAGALRFARSRSGKKASCAPATKRRRASSREGPAIALTSTILDCVRRAIGHIDLCIGDAEVSCRRRAAAATVKLHDVRGSVFVAECPEPEMWLASLAKLHREAKVSEALVVLHGLLWEPWFRAVVGSGAPWEWCFVTASEPLIVVAHLGKHPQAFRVAFGEIGAVLASGPMRN